MYFEYSGIELEYPDNEFCTSYFKLAFNALNNASYLVNVTDMYAVNA